MNAPGGIRWVPPQYWPRPAATTATEMTGQGLPAPVPGWRSFAIRLKRARNAKAESRTLAELTDDELRWIHQEVERECRKRRAQ